MSPDEKKGLQEQATGHAKWQPGAFDVVATSLPPAHRIISPPHRSLCMRARPSQFVCSALVASLIMPLASLAQPASAPIAVPPKAPSPAFLAVPASPAAPAAKPEAPAPLAVNQALLLRAPQASQLARHEKFNAIAKEGKAQLVFLGDSITQGWEGAGAKTWAERYAGRSAANFGIGGDSTGHILWRIENGNFDGIKPKLVVLMIGTNNTTASPKQSPDDIAAGIKAILEKLAAKTPDTKVLLLGIFPRGETAEDANRKNNIAVNGLIEKFADNARVYYKDISAKFVDAQGKLGKDIAPDLLHLSPAGYDRWAEAIEGDIVKLTGDSGHHLIPAIESHKITPMKPAPAPSSTPAKK